MAFPEPRPLYGLDRLAAKPAATVLLVEGEKCADAGHEELAELEKIAGDAKISARQYAENIVNQFLDERIRNDMLFELKTKKTAELKTILNELKKK